MDAVSLTFPGHFFQTALSIQSIKRWYQPNRHYIILDDLSQGGWISYTQDAEKFLRDNCNDQNLIFLKTSDFTRMDQCMSGWWRQQLIKLTIDQLISGDEWLLVDGDVIFDTYCEYRNVVPIDSRPIDPTDQIEILTRNYIRHLLGTDNTTIRYQENNYLTNAVPYRCVDRELLRKLRHHVEKKFNQDFVDLHIKWFHDQTIVGMHEDLTKFNMSEWELIEVFRKEILQQDLPCLVIGNGYPLDLDLSQMAKGYSIFRHGYVRDAQMNQDWFQKQGLKFSDLLWQKSRDWLKQQEPWRA